MTQKRFSFLASALCLLFLAAPLLAGGPHFKHHSSDAEVFDLSELANGETRTFGTGEHVITATRTGDTVSITMNDPDDGDTTFDCLIGTDNCNIVVDTGNDSHKMIIIKRTGNEASGEHTVHAFSTSGDGENTWVSDNESIQIVGDGHAAMFIGEGKGGFHFETSEGGPGQQVRIMKIGMGDKVMLRCSEGDTMMTLDKDEADVEYRCPKHGNLLKKVEHGGMHTEIIERRIIREKHADENE